MTVPTNRIDGSHRDCNWVSEAYDLLTPWYDVIQQMGGHAGYETVLPYLWQSGLPRSGRILDVGCATGQLLLKFLEAGYQVIGLDQSVGELAEAERRAFEWEEEHRSREAHRTELSEVLQESHFEAGTARHYSLYALDVLQQSWPVSEPVQAVVCWLNTANHFAPASFPFFLQEAWRVCDSGGLLFFDAMDETSMEREYGQKRFCYHKGTQRLIWQNRYDPVHKTHSAQVVWEERTLRHGRRKLGEAVVQAYPQEKAQVLQWAETLGWVLLEVQQSLEPGRWQYLFQKP